MKKKALNYIVFTLAFFSLFFSEKVFAFSGYQLSPTEQTSVSFKINTSLNTPTKWAETSYGTFDLGVQGFGTAPFENLIFSLENNQVCIAEQDGSPKLCGGNVDNGTRRICFYDGTGIGTDCSITGALSSDYEYIDYTINNSIITHVNGTWTGYGSQEQYTSTISWFTSPNWLLAGSNATTTSVTFTFPYDIAPQELSHYNEACVVYRKIDLNNASTTQNAIVSLCEPIYTSGSHIFSTTTTLADNSLFNYYGIILGTSTQPYTQQTLSNQLQTGVVYGTGITPVGWLIEDNPTATSTGFLRFLNVPELLKTKAPFAYFPQMLDIITGSSDVASSTFATTSLSFTLASGTPIKRTLSIDMFSQGVFTRYISLDIWSILRALMSAVTYLSCGLFLLHDARSKRHLF